MPELHRHQAVGIELQGTAQTDGRFHIDARPAGEHLREQRRIHVDLRREGRRIEV